VGVPPDDDLWWIQSAKAREYLKSRSGKENRSPNKDLKTLLPPDTKPLAVDFIKHMLAFNPYKRWSADWLLDHPYLADCHRPESCYRANSLFKWKWDSDYPDEQQLRKLFWKEIVQFHPEVEQQLPPLPATILTPKDGKLATKEEKPKEVKLERIPSIREAEKPMDKLTEIEKPTDKLRDTKTENVLEELKMANGVELVKDSVERMDCRRIVQQIVEARKCTPQKLVA